MDILFIYSSIHGYLGCCHFWTIKIMLLWTFMYKFLCAHVSIFSYSKYISISLGYVVNSGIAGSYVNSMFNILQNSPTVLYSGCTILYSHQQCMRVPVSPHVHQQLVIYCFFFLLFFFFFWLCRMRDLSFLTRDWTHDPCIGSRVLTTGLPGKSLFLFLLL